MVAVDAQQGDGKQGYIHFLFVVSQSAVIIKARVTEDDENVVFGRAVSDAEFGDAFKIAVGIACQVDHASSRSFEENQGKVGKIGGKWGENTPVPTGWKTGDG